MTAVEQVMPVACKGGYGRYVPVEHNLILGSSVIAQSLLHSNFLLFLFKAPGHEDIEDL
jgi:hypothetical protein